MPRRYRRQEAAASERLLAAWWIRVQESAPDTVRQTRQIGAPKTVHDLPGLEPVFSGYPPARLRCCTRNEWTYGACRRLRCPGLPQCVTAVLCSWRPTSARPLLFPRFRYALCTRQWLRHSPIHRAQYRHVVFASRIFSCSCLSISCVVIGLRSHLPR